MEVLILGLPRTGTRSLAEALNLLGYAKVYHMKDNFVRGDHLFWSRAMDAKYAGIGPPITRKDFDGLFTGEYVAMSDYPAAMFHDELITAYPSAKVILLTRDEDGWVKSMEDTLLHFWNAQREARTAGTQNEPADPMRLARDEMVRKIQTYAWDGDFAANGRRLFRKHNEHVRQLMEDRPGDFLEYKVAEGWDRLCQFLGKDVPGQGFPRKDDWAEYKADVKRQD